MSQQMYQQSLTIPTRVDGSHEQHTWRHPYLGPTTLRYFHSVTLAYTSCFTSYKAHCLQAVAQRNDNDGTRAVTSWAPT